MPNLNALLLTVAACATLSACGGGGSTDDPLRRENASAGNVLVYESRQAIQCTTRGLTTQQSAQKLVNGGIDVLESNCGVNTNIVFPAVCGAGTPYLLLHKIRSANLEDAERLGFNAVAELQNPTTGIGYAKVDCDTGAPLP
jgi:hypothetical protein